MMRSVFEGGEGYISGGRLERSRERDVRQGFCEGLEEGDSGGEADMFGIVDDAMMDGG